MSCGRNECYASCPASTVTIQPPPFVLTIPGPALYCPDQPLCIEQCNPCAAIQSSEEVARGGYSSVSTGYTSSSRQSQKSLPRTQKESSSSRRF
ncbi:Keratin-associated 12-2 [Podarcis lilfordi]|uniref:Keratin-associated 12-2 n=1 Tax=Podarcis lilfordi TaxID=74358 RepID=A0AA35PS59_9SAUR|nr:Keratin-associated 12-2 [Podarcis lilfordi]